MVYPSFAVNGNLVQAINSLKRYLSQDWQILEQAGLHPERRQYLLGVLENWAGETKREGNPYRLPADDLLDLQMSAYLIYAIENRIAQGLEKLVTAEIQSPLEIDERTIWMHYDSAIIQRATSQRAREAYETIEHYAEIKMRRMKMADSGRYERFKLIERLFDKITPL